MIYRSSQPSAPRTMAILTVSQERQVTCYFPRASMRQEIQMNWRNTWRSASFLAYQNWLENLKFGRKKFGEVGVRSPDYMLLFLANIITNRLRCRNEELSMMAVLRRRMILIITIIIIATNTNTCLNIPRISIMFVNTIHRTIIYMTTNDLPIHITIRILRRRRIQKDHSEIWGI